MKIPFLVLLYLFASSVSAEVAQHVEVENAFARAAIQQQRNSAAFMTLHNAGSATHIAYAKSPVADIVELHTHINDQGVMRMRKIAQIDLPAAGTVVLKPGGLHVMLLGLKQDLNKGEQIPVTLGFSDGSEKQLSIPVRMVRMQHMKGQQGHQATDSKPVMMRH